MEARAECFGERAAGSAFTVYARTGPGKVQVRNYAVTPGDRLEDSWSLRDFADGRYCLQVYGPNGFFREFTGGGDDPPVDIALVYRETAPNSRSLSGDVEIRLHNRDPRRATSIQIRDRSYGSPAIEREVAGGATILVHVDTRTSFQWYDLDVLIPTSPGFQRRFAGRVETGKWTMTDPAIGRERV
jgi:phospholipase C